MYETLETQGVEQVLSYLEQDLKHALYGYIDIKKYGLENPHLKVYYKKKGTELAAVATEYYKGIQLASLGEELPVAETVDLIRSLDTPMINGRTGLIDRLEPYLTAAYEREDGYVAWMHQLNEGADFSQVEEASEADFPEIAELICSDRDLGGHYVPEEFAKQLLDRKREQFGRSYVLKKDGRIACHAATYAEIDNLAIVSGVITRADYRGQGLGYQVVSKLCHDLLEEGKKPCIFYFKKEAAGLYRKVGFQEGTGWAKLSKRQ